MKKKLKSGIALALIISLILAGVRQERTDQAVSASALPEPVCTYSFNQSVGTSMVVTRDNDTLEGGNLGTVPKRAKEKEAVFKQGKSGQGLYLDGTYGLRLYPQMETSDYTISFWVKPEHPADYSTLLCAGESFFMDDESNLTLTGDQTTSPIVITASPQGGYIAGKNNSVKDGEWNFICMTVQGGTVTFYVNGNVCSTGQIVNDMLHKDMQWYLGIDCYNTLYQGTIDNLSFYESCLTADMAAQLYQSQNSETISGNVTGISLNKEEAALNGAGSIEALYAIFQPQNAENQGITWSSSDTGIADVENGVVTAVKNGRAVITAKTEDGSYQAECKVAVTGITDLKKIVFSQSTLALSGDESKETLIPVAQPESAVLPELIWSSSASNVAAVDQNGIVFAVANGEAVITAETEDGSLSASCMVTVRDVSKEVAVESITLSKGSFKLTEKKDTAVLSANIIPVNAANQEITWSSSDYSVASVDQKGTVTAVGNGSAQISVITSDGRFTASCMVSVSGFTDTDITDIKLDTESMEIEQGGTGYLYAQVSPVTATERLDWHSSNPDVADVVADEFGTSAEIIVYDDAVMGGTAVITASSETGVSAECFVKVTEYGVQKLTINKSNISLLPGKSYHMDATIKPQAAETSELLWKSSNVKVASVNNNGVVKVKKNARAGQKAKIISMTLSKTKKATCVITVRQKKIKIKKLTAKKNSYTLYPGDKSKFSVSYSPDNATENKITYSSQNSKIVKIDQKGNISIPPDYKGTAEVKVTAKAAGGKKVTAAINVKQEEVKAKSLSLSKSSLSLYGGQNTTLYAKYKPAKANSTDIVWNSSDNSVVTINGSGKKASVYIKKVSKKDSVVITAKDRTGGATAQCQIYVTPRVQEDAVIQKPDAKPQENNKNEAENKKEAKSISFGNVSYIAVKKGKTVNLEERLSVDPTDADYKLTWKSNNSYIAVSSKGVVSVSAKTPKNLQNTILVTTDNGKKTTITIKVEEK